MTSWHVPTWTGSNSYRFSRHVVVTSDSAHEEPLVFDTTGAETLVHRTASRSNTFTLAASPQGENVRQVSAAVVDGQPILTNENGAAAQCDPSRNQLRSDLSDLALHIPGTLSTRMSWADSAASDVCVGAAPGTARTSRHFTVVGDTAVNKDRAVIISRRDSTNITADGIVEQHPTAISGSAISNVLLYVSESSGSVLRLTKEQVLVLSIAAEGSTRTFTQKLTSAVELVR